MDLNAEFDRAALECADFCLALRHLYSPGPPYKTIGILALLGWPVLIEFHLRVFPHENWQIKKED